MHRSQPIGSSEALRLGAVSICGRVQAACIAETVRMAEAIAQWPLNPKTGPRSNYVATLPRSDGAVVGGARRLEFISPQGRVRHEGLSFGVARANGSEPASRHSRATRSDLSSAINRLTKIPDAAIRRAMRSASAQRLCRQAKQIMCACWASLW